MVKSVGKSQNLRKTHLMSTRHDVKIARGDSGDSEGDSGDSEGDSEGDSGDYGDNVDDFLKVRRKITKSRGGDGGRQPLVLLVLNDTEDDEDQDEDNEEGDENKDKEEAKGWLNKYKDDERAYYDRVSDDMREKIDDKEDDIMRLRAEENDVPMRFRILNSSIPTENVYAILNRIKGTSDKDKKVEFVNNISRIPFGRYATLPIGPHSTPEETRSFLQGVQSKMDSEVYGMDRVKSMFMMTVAKWASNPSSKGLVVGLRGPMGVGKTTLVKDGLGKALGIPSSFIALGSANDSSFLDGHGYTYEGSVCGQIADSLMTCGVMNPILCFDELDKVADNSRGNEIYNTLIHLTDSSQNSNFCDKYFGSNVPLDLSRCIFVFTYNDHKDINPILRNRMIEISIPDYDSKEKKHILKEFIVPKALKEYSSSLRVSLDDASLDFLIERSSSAQGMRSMQHDVDDVLGALNLEMMMQGRTDVGLVTRDRISQILKSRDVDIKGPPLPQGVQHMYS